MTRAPNADFRSVIVIPATGVLVMTKPMNEGVHEDGSIDVALYNPKPVEYAVDKTFVLKEANVLFGSGGTDKSTLMAHLCVCAVTGHRWLGRATRRGRVLYLDWESSGDTVTWRVRRIARGQDVTLPLGQFIYKRIRRPILAALDEIVTLIKRYRPTYVVIDSMGFSMGGDTQKEALVLQVFEALSGPVEENEVCLIFVDHTPHSNTEKEYGSEYKRNAVRAQWLIKEARAYEVTPDGERVFLELINKKLSFRRRDDSIFVQIDFHDTYDVPMPDNLQMPDGPIVVDEYDPMMLPHSPGATELRETEVLRAVYDEPGTYKQIAERTGIKEAYVQDILTTLKKRGTVTNSGGVWRVA
jgi:hypothetical protein